MGISKDLTEEDIKFRYINEAITSKGWSKDSIFMEQKVKFTDGKISLHGNLVHREKPKFADYVVRITGSDDYGKGKLDYFISVAEKYPVIATTSKLLRTESITDYTKKSIIDTYATIDTFTSKWQETKKKSDIAEMLKDRGIDLAALKHDQDMDDVDDFDFICHIAYGKKTLTRHERAEQVKKRDIFSKYGEQARLVQVPERG